MNNETLKKQVERINQQIANGKTVTLNLQGDQKSARLKVDKKSVQGISQKKSHSGKAKPNFNEVLDDELIAVGDELPNDAAFSLDLSGNDISDDEINAKISAASNLAQTENIAPTPSVLPKVTLTRDDAKSLWVLDADCSYTPDFISPAHVITAPKDFETDLSSIPRIFWSIIEPAELSLAAPIFHDLIYRHAGNLPPSELDPDDYTFQRYEVDNLFLELMTKAGIPAWKRTVAYWAVRGFAGFAWRVQP